jgi:thiosulfate/3-mercaptopyruvate sulfurtransferase
LKNTAYDEYQFAIFVICVFLQKVPVMNKIIYIAFILIGVAAFALQTQKDTWTEKQLLAPAQLAKTLSDASAKKPLIYNIGFGGGIPGSIDIGAGRDQASIDKLKEALAKVPKDADIVIYCGCCPFVKCPNVRPAMAAVNEMKFINAKLLNLATNLKTDWIDKGYPVQK